MTPSAVPGMRGIKGRGRVRETVGLDVGFAWPNGSAGKEVENDTDLELSEHAELGDDSHPRVLPAS